jgi:preprotein translocase SecE subunit
LAEGAKKRKVRRLKKTETVRQRSEKSTKVVEKPRHIRRAAKTVAKPFGFAWHVGRKEYYLPLPDNKFGRFLNKRRRFTPKFFREAWQELKQTTWPSRRETAQLTFAVFIFAFVFGLLIAVTDYGLDKVFKRILLK